MDWESFGFWVCLTRIVLNLVSLSDAVDSMVMVSNSRNGRRATRWLDLRVNGVAVQCSEGGRVLDAVRDAGFEVPTLCYDERVGPQGTCRMCLVEVEVNGRVRSRWRLALRFRKHGMSMYATHTDEIQGRIERRCWRCCFRRCLRRTIIRIRIRLGPTEFDRAVEEYEAKWDALPHLGAREKASHDTNPFIQRDYDYCIACYRCTNICNDWEQAGAHHGRWSGSDIEHLYVFR